MPEVQNIGAMDYDQYQPSQYPSYEEDYSSQPVVYDESAEEMRAASSSRMGATILTGTIVAGLGLLGGYFIGKHGKVSGKDVDKVKDELKNVKDELDSLKNSEAVKHYDKLKEASENVEKEIENHSSWSWWGIKNKVKSIFKPVKDDIAKTQEEAKKAAEEAKKAAEETADSAKENSEQINEFI